MGALQAPAPSLIPPNQRVTTTATRSSRWPSMVARIDRPGVPAGSPSSWDRYAVPSRHAQQSWLAAASAMAAIQAVAASTQTPGAAWVTKRLRRMSRLRLQGRARVWSTGG
jgi:hypothetical protein